MYPKCMSSGREIKSEKELVFSPLPPSALEALASFTKSPVDFYLALIQNFFLCRLYVYHIETFQGKLKQYFGGLKEAGLSGAPGFNEYSDFVTSKGALRFSTNPKTVLLIILLIDFLAVVFGSFIGFLLLSGAGKLATSLDSSGFGMLIFWILLLAALLFANIFWIGNYFRIVRPILKSFQ